MSLGGWRGWGLSWRVIFVEGIEDVECGGGRTIRSKNSEKFRGFGFRFIGERSENALEKEVGLNYGGVKGLYLIL